MGQREIGLCVLWACVWEGSSPPKMPTKKKKPVGIVEWQRWSKKNRKRVQSRPRPLFVAAPGTSPTSECVHAWLVFVIRVGYWVLLF